MAKIYSIDKDIIKDEDIDIDNNKEIESEEECPFCSTVREVLKDILGSNDYDEQFGILHSVMNQVQEIGFQEGYVGSLRNQSKMLDEIADDMDEGLYEDDD